MTWIGPPTWQLHYDPKTHLLEIQDATGRPRARLDPFPPTVDPDAGFFRKIDQRLSQGVGPVIWHQDHGRLADGQTATVQLPDGNTGRLANGRTKGWRRVHRNGTIQLAGRAYAVTHHGRRRTRLSRDGAELVRMRRPVRFLNEHKADEPLRARMRLNQPLDQVDELAAVLTMTVLGPTGRPGWWSQLFDELSF
ncbi:hypothetical protein [Nocardioides alcanivorans]|uniref:hypothetical protein n=1 Tax=Nocardioides alcanivorans TaxID=2897352 RepID=UPI001F27B866|nr:hypothetical protein [Nocardioides alcanivorans]